MNGQREQRSSQNRTDWEEVFVLDSSKIGSRHAWFTRKASQLYSFDGLHYSLLKTGYMGNSSTIDCVQVCPFQWVSAGLKRLGMS